MAAPTQLIQVIGRDGDQLRVTQGAALPDYCVKCGKPSTHRIKKTFYWHTPWLYLLVLIGVLIYAIVAIIVRKKLYLEVPLCEEHWQARRQKFQIAIALLVAFIPFGVAVGTMSPENAGWGWLIAVIMFFTGVVFASLAASIISPTYIDNTYGKFKKVAPEFLALLPNK